MLENVLYAVNYLQRRGKMLLVAVVNAKKVNCINNRKKQAKMKKVKRAEKRNKIPNKDLLDIDKAAKLAGMTYGQYVAKMGL